MVCLMRHVDFVAHRRTCVFLWYQQQVGKRLLGQGQGAAIAHCPAQKLKGDKASHSQEYKLA